MVTSLVVWFGCAYNKDFEGVYIGAVIIDVVGIFFTYDITSRLVG